MVKPLYEATKAPEEELYFGMDNRKIFNDNEQALTRAPAQSSHFEKAIHLICGWKAGEDLKVLIQKLGEIPHL